MKLFSAVILGVLLHMLYLDGIFVYEHKLADKCFTENDDTRPEISQACLERLNDMSRYKGKYFNIAQALTYKKIFAKWNME